MQSAVLADVDLTLWPKGTGASYDMYADTSTIVQDADVDCADKPIVECLLAADNGSLRAPDPVRALCICMPCKRPLNVRQTSSSVLFRLQQYPKPLPRTPLRMLGGCT